MNEPAPRTLPLILWILWLALMGLVVGITVWFSSLFGYAYTVPQMPLKSFFGMIFGAGFLFLFLPFLLHISIKRLSALDKKVLLYSLLLAGLFFRGLMFLTEPVMEDDYQRYMWDGAVTANGYNPYQYAPKDILQGKEGDARLQELVEMSGPVLGRVNHPQLRTIYPPVAQAAFAVAYFIKPFHLNAWRLVGLGLELVSILLILLILKKLGLSLLWSSLYWLNPLVIKELINSGHMEVLLVPLLLLALYTSLKGRIWIPALALSVAAAVKLWPILLLPVVLYKIRDQWRKVLLILGISAGLVILFFMPVFWAGLDSSSGFVAYAQRWQTNSALTPLMVKTATFLLAPLHLETTTVSLLVRVFIGLLLSGVAVWIALKKEENGKDHAWKFLVIAATVFLLSPAQFPWYTLWFLPFLVFFPVPALLLIVATVQVYYLGFDFMVRGEMEFFRQYIVSAEWLPVWGMLGWMFYRKLACQVREQMKRAANAGGKENV